MKTKLSGKTLLVKVCDKEIEIPAQRGKAIKAFCTDCSCGQSVEVRECPSTMCPLYSFRGYIKWNTDAYDNEIDPEEALDVQEDE